MGGCSRPPDQDSSTTPHISQPTLPRPKWTNWVTWLSSYKGAWKVGARDTVNPLITPTSVPFSLLSCVLAFKGPACPWESAVDCPPEQFCLLMHKTQDSWMASWWENMKVWLPCLHWDLRGVLYKPGLSGNQAALALACLLPTPISVFTYSTADTQPLLSGLLLEKPARDSGEQNWHDGLDQSGSTAWG